MDRALQTFEGLIRRSIAPSVTFFVIFVVGELIAVELGGGSAPEWITGWLAVLGDTFGESPGFFGTMAVLVVLGVGYGLSAIQQVLFDNRLNESFDPGRLSHWLAGSSVKSEGRALRELRGEVLERLDSEPRLARFRPLRERTDYLLYEILGGIDPTDTRPFVDTAKAIGIVFSSAIAVTLWNLGRSARDLLEVWTLSPGWWQVAGLAILAILVVILYWIGREATAAQYRTRALRLYANFLMMPTERLERRLLYPDEKSISGGKTGDE